MIGPPVARSTAMTPEQKTAYTKLFKGCNVTLSWTLYRPLPDGGEREFNVEVGASISRYRPARTSGLPENCSPSEGGDVEDMVAWDDDNACEVELTEAEKDDLADRLRDKHSDDDDGPDPDARDRAEDRERDDDYFAGSDY